MAARTSTRQHHAPHSYIGVAGPLDIIPARERRLIVVNAAGPMSLLGREGNCVWSSGLVVSLAQGSISFQIVPRYPHRQRLVDGHKSQLFPAISSCSNPIVPGVLLTVLRFLV